MDLSLSLAGLNDYQLMLADMIWACHTQLELDLLLQMLPTEEMRHDAGVIVDLMIMEGIDQCVTLPEHMEYAQHIIDKVK
jgi:hypothetical protein